MIPGNQNRFPPQQMGPNMQGMVPMPMPVNNSGMMMAPGMMMPPQGMMPGFMPPPQAQGFQQQVPVSQGFGQGGGPPVPGGIPGGVAPPGYSPEMAKEFKEKQEKLMKQQQRMMERQHKEQMKMMEQQKKRMEQEMKHKQFQEQQKKLKEFSTIGGRKNMNADSLIESIIGKSEPTRGQRPNAPAGVMSQPGTLPNMMMSQGAHPMGGGNMQTMGGANMQPIGGVNMHTMIPPGGGVNQGVMQARTENSQPATDEGFGDFMSNPVPPVSNTIVNPPPANQIPEEKKAPPPDPKKDLMNMMLNSCDLSVPKEAKSFKVKTSLKEVQPKSVKTSTYHESHNARHWDAQSEQLSELFTLPEAKKDQPAAPLMVPPKWITGEAPVPDVYIHVLEAATVDGKIDTGILYPILLRSGLPKEALGHLWSLCNKKVAGQLSRDELYILLAMIAIGQNNMSIQSIDILLKCPHAPIPNLGQGPPSGTAAANTATHTQHSGTPTTPAGAQGAHTSTAKLPSPTHTSTSQMSQHGHPSNPTFQQPQVNGSSTLEDDDFDDFKSAPVPSHPVSSAGMPSTSTMSAPGSLGGLNGGLTIPTSPVLPNVKSSSDLMGDDKYGALKAVGGINDNASVTSGTTENNSLANEDAEFADFASFNSSTTDATSSSQSDVGMGDFSKFDAMSHPVSKTDDSTISWAFSDDDVKIDNKFTMKNDIKDTNEDGFADFKSATLPAPPSNIHSKQSSIKPPAVNERLASVKALVNNKNLFSQKPKPIETDMDKVENDKNNALLEGDDWAEFKGSSLSDTTPSSSDKFDAFKDTSSDSWSILSSQPKTDTSTGEDEGWASFQSHPSSNNTSDDLFSQPPKEDPTNTTDLFSQSSKMETTDVVPPSDKFKVDSSKANSIFGQNLQPNAPSVGLGMSPFDTAPPDIPDDNDNDNDFDHFGTFQTGPDLTDTEGISSLTAPYGGLDDFDVMKNEMMKPSDSKHSISKTISSGSLSHSQSASSFEFSGWREGAKSLAPDNHSMKSLDLRPQKVASSKESSPGGVDSQSVSSLEFPASESRKSNTPQDSRSEASLDLSQNEGITGTGDINKNQVTIQNTEQIDNTMSTLNIEPHKPRNVTEIAGDLPNFGVTDRYKGLIGEPEDSDRHLWAWEECLKAAQQMINTANNTFNSVSSSRICKEIFASKDGAEFVRGLVEVYKLMCKISVAMAGFSANTDKLSELMKEIKSSWGCFTVFIGTTEFMPQESELDFSPILLKSEPDNSHQRVCGICLLDTEKSMNKSNDNDRLMYGGRYYHCPCANFWVNCVNSTLPALKIPELL